nr:MAG: hypothetical protein [Wufeng shrew picorna-like virus 52]
MSSSRQDENLNITTVSDAFQTRVFEERPDVASKIEGTATPSQYADQFAYLLEFAKKERLMYDYEINAASGANTTSRWSFKMSDFGAHMRAFQTRDISPLIFKDFNADGNKNIYQIMSGVPKFRIVFQGQFQIIGEIFAAWYPLDVNMRRRMLGFGDIWSDSSVIDYQYLTTIYDDDRIAHGDVSRAGELIVNGSWPANIPFAYYDQDIFLGRLIISSATGFVVNDNSDARINVQVYMSWQDVKFTGYTGVLS